MLLSVDSLIFFYSAARYREVYDVEDIRNITYLKKFPLLELTSSYEINVGQDAMAMSRSFNRSLQRTNEVRDPVAAIVPLETSTND